MFYKLPRLFATHVFCFEISANTGDGYQVPGDQSTIQWACEVVVGGIRLDLTSHSESRWWCAATHIWFDQSLSLPPAVSQFSWSWFSAAPCEAEHTHCAMLVVADVRMLPGLWLHATDVCCECAKNEFLHDTLHTAMFDCRYARTIWHSHFQWYEPAISLSNTSRCPVVHKLGDWSTHYTQCIAHSCAPINTTQNYYIDA